MPPSRTTSAPGSAELATLPVPAVPPGDGAEIDRFLAARWAANNVTPPAVVDDRAFARRAYLDVIGLPPTAEQLEQFASDNAANKREKLVDALLADKQGYAENWMAFWNDLSRNDEQTNIDGLRKPITAWLYRSLLENKPLDQFTAELLNPGKDGPDGYLKGVNWRGRVNASQTPPVQAAQNVSQVFLASSIKCASCHDSFINDWKLEQAYGMASFFSPQNLEMARCDKPTGKIVAPKFLFPDLGDVDPERRRADAAEGRGGDGDAAQKSALRADDGEPLVEAADGPRPVRAGRRLRRQGAGGRPARLAGLRFHGPRL